MKISDALKELIGGNQWLAFGFQQGIFNLTKLSSFIKPQIEARIDKKVTDSSVLMALSRFQKQESNKFGHLPKFKIANLTLNSGLVEYTFFKNPSSHKLVNDFYTEVQKYRGYVNITEGINEINLIFAKEFQDILDDKLDMDYKFKADHLASLVVKFTSDYSEVPGFIFFVIQQIYMQNINLIEISSTFTELIIYVDKKDAKLAFDTLYNFLED